MHDGIGLGAAFDEEEHIVVIVAPCEDAELSGEPEAKVMGMGTASSRAGNALGLVSRRSAAQ
ncbi:MAG: hypothetical protein ACYC8T_16105 [Myxococcaceae bacterium]